MRDAAREALLRALLVAGAARPKGDMHSLLMRGLAEPDAAAVAAAAGASAASAGAARRPRGGARKGRKAAAAAAGDAALASSLLASTAPPADIEVELQVRPRHMGRT